MNDLTFRINDEIKEINELKKLFQNVPTVKIEPGTNGLFHAYAKRGDVQLYDVFKLSFSSQSWATMPGDQLSDFCDLVISELQAFGKSQRRKFRRNRKNMLASFKCTNPM